GFRGPNCARLAAALLSIFIRTLIITRGKSWERRHPCRRGFPHVFGDSRRQGCRRSQGLEQALSKRSSFLTCLRGERVVNWAGQLCRAMGNNAGLESNGFRETKSAANQARSKEASPTLALDYFPRR